MSNSDNSVINPFLAGIGRFEEFCRQTGIKLGTKHSDILAALPDVLRHLIIKGMDLGVGMVDIPRSWVPLSGKLGDDGLEYLEAGMRAAVTGIQTGLKGLKDLSPEDRAGKIREAVTKAAPLMPSGKQTLGQVYQAWAMEDLAANPGEVPTSRAPHQFFVKYQNLKPKTQHLFMMAIANAGADAIDLMKFVAAELEVKEWPTFLASCASASSEQGGGLIATLMGQKARSDETEGEEWERALDRFQKWMKEKKASRDAKNAEEESSFAEALVKEENEPEHTKGSWGLLYSALAFAVVGALVFGLYLHNIPNVHP